MGTLKQSEFTTFSAKAQESGRTIKRSERLEVGGGSRGLGSLRVFFLPSGGIYFYYGHKTRLGEQDDYPLGLYAHSRSEANSAGGNCLTLAMARQKALEASKRHSGALELGFDGIRSWEKQKAAEESKRSLFCDVDTSLKALMLLYTDVMKKQGKYEHAKSVLNVCKNHLFPFDVSYVSSKDVEKKDVATVLRRVKESGKKRTYQKLRSYLLAAYNMALDAEYDESCDSRFIPFEITTVPIAKTNDRSALVMNKRTRFLSIEEIVSLWQWLEEHSGYQSDFLKLKLLTGQRTIQMLRLDVSSIDPIERMTIILDGKGRRIEPRRHPVPFADEAWKLISKFSDVSTSVGKDALFLNTKLRRANRNSLTKFCKDASVELFNEGKVVEPFILSDLRRTFETHSARLKISSDVRAHLASHGISGVQEKHYNMYDYKDDKREAFALWERELLRIISGRYNNVVVRSFA